MITESHLQAGNRVRTTQEGAGLPLGSIGTIRQVFRGEELYDVRFDGKLLPRLVHSSTLELIPAGLSAREMGE